MTGSVAKRDAPDGQGDNVLAVVYTTARLALYPAFPAAFQALYEKAFSRPAVMQQAFMGKVFDRQEAEQFFLTKLDHAADGRCPGVLVERTTDEVIGMAGLMSCEVLGRADYEIGFVLAEQAWGKGYATEIGYAQLEFGFAQLGCQRLLAQVAPGNHASRAVLEKLGMSLHATVESPGRGKRLVYVKASN